MIRVSTSMIFDAGVNAMNSQTAAVLHLQQQVASGRRILTPSDDPVNAARALVVSQSADVTAQYSTNQDNAKSALGLEETQLSGVIDVLGRLKELAVQAGGPSLSASDRKNIATEARARFDQLLGMANAANGSGQYMFAGFKGDTRPFGASVDTMIQSGADIQYQGDDGQQRLQVAPNRYLEVSDAGNDVFSRIKNGNGTFATTYASTNTGTGAINGGNVTNPASWVAPTSGAYTIQFSVAAGVTTYQIFDGATPLLATPGTYASGQPIPLQNTTTAPITDFGASVTITGNPANGDSYTIAPSKSQSLFKTLADLIGALENGASGAAATAKLTTDIGAALNNIDHASENVLRVRAEVGSRLSEIDSLSNVNQDLALQYAQTLSNLQDLDYNKALSDLTRKQTELEAAQKSFASTSKLSLFNYI
ncbi:MAG TPA: flagellar hook-associated protein FlgL [Rhodocyclaceae bacterium]|nr:flagellar hook-associated protein FlgL [Rhodocyclaceae bacterium]